MLVSLKWVKFFFNVEFRDRQCPLITNSSLMDRSMISTLLLICWIESTFEMMLPSWWLCEIPLQIHCRLSTILKTSSKSVWSNVFWQVKAFIFWRCIQYTIHWDKTQMLKKISVGQNKRYKNVLFSNSSTVLLLICDSYMSWNNTFVSLKLWVGFSIFDSVSFLLKVIFLFSKMHGVFDFNKS